MRYKGFFVNPWFVTVAGGLLVAVLWATLRGDWSPHSRLSLVKEKNPGCERPDQVSETVFAGSIFDLRDRLSKTSTILEYENTYQDYTGLIVFDCGYVGNIVPIGDKYMVFIKNNAAGYASISCLFDEIWGKKLRTHDLNEAIGFQGIITRSPFTPGGNVELRDCGLR